MQRAMFFDFPDDRNTAYLDQQFMFGSSLLVAPVFCKDTEETSIYLPEGEWTSLWDSSYVINGPRWIKRKVPYDEVPVFVRENTMLVLGQPGMRQPDYDYVVKPYVRVYGLKEEGMTATFDVPSGRGTGRSASLKATRLGGKMKVEVVEGSLEGVWSLTAIAGGETWGPSFFKGSAGTVG